MSEELKYPVLLVHGMGFRDSKYLNYWGRIPAKLEENGCRIYYGNQDSNGTVASNGAYLADKIRDILSQTGAPKLNVIAHSKGGLDMRYAISTLKMSEYIASLTTISTPHHGSLTVDKLLQFPDFMVRFVAGCWDIWLRICGDKNPNAYEVFKIFSTAEAEAFNRQNPDAPEVYYQSYAFVMKHVWSDMFMIVPATVVKFLKAQTMACLRRGLSHGQISAVSLPAAQTGEFPTATRCTCAAEDSPAKRARASAISRTFTLPLSTTYAREDFMCLLFQQLLLKYFDLLQNMSHVSSSCVL